MNDITELLIKVELGDAVATEQLLPLVYDELRRLAAIRFSREKPGQTLQANALVHEAFLRLVDTDKVQNWDSRGHFFAAASEAIRRILIDQARRKASAKAGGEFQRIELSQLEDEAIGQDWNLLELNEALERLEAEDPRAGQIVKLRFFGGLTREEAADSLGVSVATADNDWAYAKGFLQLQLSGTDG